MTYYLMCAVAVGVIGFTAGVLGLDRVITTVSRKINKTKNGN